jgi:hypothetical protein
VAGCLAAVLPQVYGEVSLTATINMIEVLLMLFDSRLEKRAFLHKIIKNQWYTLAFQV